MKVTGRFFASLREALGSGETLDLAAGATVGDVRSVLMQRSAAHAAALARGRALRCALDQNLCNESTPLPETCEVAFFPPVTGG